MRYLLIALLSMLSLGAKAQTAPAVPPAIDALMTKYTCKSCHRMDMRLVGPAFQEIMRTKKYTAAQIVALIYKPMPNHWPDYPPMAAVTWMPKADALKVAKWIASIK